MRKPWERGVYSVGVCPPLPHRTNLRSDKNPASSTVRMRDSPMRGGVVIMGCYCFTTTGGVTPSLPLSTILHVNLASQRHLVNLMCRSLRHILFPQYSAVLWGFRTLRAPATTQADGGSLLLHQVHPHLNAGSAGIYTPAPQEAQDRYPAPP